MQERNGKTLDATREALPRAFSPELLAPGGSFEGLRAAIRAGADAVYAGGELFGARAYAGNLGPELLLEALDYCHIHGRKLYLTVNTLLKEEELAGKLCAYLEPLYLHGLDAVLVQDPGVWRLLQREFPDLPLHASTQMSVQSPEGALWLKRRGAARIVPARELSLEEIREIYTATGMEIECFVHGALCYSYSGQCLMSSLIGGRSGNRGRCAQPCRQAYTLTDAAGSPIGRKGQYLLSLKDICTLKLLPDLVEAGVCSFKIEGRMKRPEYAAGVTEIYRRYLDQYLCRGKAEYEVDPSDISRLKDLYNRGGFSEGYYQMPRGVSMMALSRPNHAGTPGARVLEARGEGRLRLRALEDLHPGDVLELEDAPGHGGRELTLKEQVSAGTTFFVSASPRRIKAGNSLPRVRAQGLLDEIGARFLETEIKEKIKGMFILKPGSPAILKVRLGSAMAQVRGPVPEPALQRSVTDEELRRQLKKTGNTPFVFDSLEISMEEGLFFSMRTVNEMRRNALRELEEKLLLPFRRGKEASAEQIRNSGIPEDGWASEGAETAQPPRIICSAQTRAQMEVILRFPGAEELWADSLCWLDAASGSREEITDLVREASRRGKRVFLTLPPVWRKRTREAFERTFSEDLLEAFDGFVIRCADQISRFAERFPGKRLITEGNVYSFNTEALRFWKESGIDACVLPAELNAGELRALAETNPACELILPVYGFERVMTAAQCVRNNTTGCDKTPGLMYLRDRTGAMFPVKNHCGICCNLIYNSLPLSLLDQREAPARVGARGWLLRFVTEDSAAAERILRNVFEGDTPPQGRTFEGDTPPQGRAFEGHMPATRGQASGKVTRGHFRRGIE